MQPLTPREREILHLIPTHPRVDEQASVLGISHSTVRKHRTNICAKLGLHGTAGLIAHAHALSLSHATLSIHRTVPTAHPP